MEKADFRGLAEGIIQQEQSQATNSEKPASRTSKCPCSNELYCSYKKPIILPAGLKGLSFEKYCKNDGNARAYEHSVSFLASNKSLFLYGEPGTGKTHLLISALKKAMSEMCSYQLYYNNIGKLLKIERGEYETKEESEDRVLTSLGKKDIIFLDDFCAENVTGKTAEFLYLLLNDAVESGRTRFFITSNKSVPYINDRISARIASRIGGLCGKDNIVKIEGDDWRLK